MKKYNLRLIFSVLLLVVPVNLISPVMAVPPTVKPAVLKNYDLNYRYTVKSIGTVVDFSEEPKKKISLEIAIESIYGGFEWFPFNPVILDDQERLLNDYKVIVGVPAGNVVTVKYLITPSYDNIHYLSIYEDGITENGKRSYKMSLRHIPLEIKSQ